MDEYTILHPCIVHTNTTIMHCVILDTWDDFILYFCNTSMNYNFFHDVNTCVLSHFFHSVAIYNDKLSLSKISIAYCIVKFKTKILPKKSYLPHVVFHTVICPAVIVLCIVRLNSRRTFTCVVGPVFSPNCYWRLVKAYFTCLVVVTWDIIHIFGFSHLKLMKIWSACV